VLHGICADPRTESGRYLSNEDKKALDDVVKPLRARVMEFERIRKKYKSALAALDQDFEAKIVKTVNTGQPFTDADLQRVKSLRLDHDARRTALVQQGERELEGLKALQQELEKVGDECPAAAATVPD
jgi:cell division septum initiation protein DivIVA